MSNEKLVFYWGPPGAGRAASVATFVSKLEKPVTGDRDFSVNLGSRTATLYFSSFATKFYYDMAVPERPKGFEPVLQRLAKASGVVFVVDSQEVRREANIGWLKRLRADLLLAGRSLDDLPIVFQLNKRDLPDVADVAELQRELRTDWCAYVESIAPKRIGTSEAIDHLFRLIAEGPPRH
ncbi:hypothetical protein [Chondromyces apiculatus]|uniref:hypothetical protein n=1 Tax=Chondromyces apiculatus TaxID=51 RepID=UPI0012DD8C2A|nr:hypothetical protein [Chondromyces apiculatus]